MKDIDPIDWNTAEYPDQQIKPVAPSSRGQARQPSAKQEKSEEATDEAPDRHDR